MTKLRKTWAATRPDIENRLNDFKRVWIKGTDKDIFSELVFCLFTPQSKAKSCWQAVGTLKAQNLLFKGSKSQISAKINNVRFRNNKAEYVVLARKQFLAKKQLPLKKLLSGFNDTYEAREWLARNVKGMGYKEASHFLRNIGLGKNLAILDRHILKNLKLAGVIKAVPKTLAKKQYLSLERKMADFAKKSKIPLSHLDLLFWCKETGEIFK